MSLHVNTQVAFYSAVVSASGLRFLHAGECSPVLTFAGMSVPEKAGLAAMCRFAWPCRAKGASPAAVSEQLPLGELSGSDLAAHDGPL